MKTIPTLLIVAGFACSSGSNPQSHQTRIVCSAPYYGMGNGDGVLDRRCFRLQSRLSVAAIRGDVAKIRNLLRRGANASSYAGDYLPPLFGASAEGHTTAVRLLLDNGAEMNHRYTLRGTPLFAAVYGHHAGVVALLISRGVDVNLRNGNDTCLKIAQANGFTDIVAILKNAGAKE